MNNIKGTIKEKLLGILFVFSLMLAGGYNQVYKSPVHKPSKIPKRQNPQVFYQYPLDQDSVFDYYTDEELLKTGTLGGILEIRTLPEINDDESDDPIDDHIILRFMELLSGESIRE